MRKSGLAREEVFISASLGYTLWLLILLTHLQASKISSPDHGYDKTLKKLEKSLSEFAFTYLDLFLIHDPLSGKRLETWRAMIKARDEGKIKSIGVSN